MVRLKTEPKNICKDLFIASIQILLKTIKYTNYQAMVSKSKNDTCHFLNFDAILDIQSIGQF